MSGKAWGPCAAAIVLAFCVPPASMVAGQDVEEKSRLIVQRITIPNFIDDPIVLGSLLPGERRSPVLPSVFVLSSPETGQQICWDPGSCRLLAVRSGPNPREVNRFRDLRAEGAHPLSVSMGALGRPIFFGFRVEDGIPRFLYTFGQLSVEERIDLSADGQFLFQHFIIKANPSSGAVRVPESWQSFASADKGKWGANVLSLTREEFAEGFTITYRLTMTPEEAAALASEGASAASEQ